MTSEIYGKPWQVTAATSFRNQKRTFHFIQRHQVIVLEQGPLGVEVLCCEAPAVDGGTTPEVLRRLPGFSGRRIGDDTDSDHVHVLRGEATVEGAWCELEMVVCGPRLFGSIRPAAEGDDTIGDDDATGVWTAEDPGGGQGDGG